MKYRALSLALAFVLAGLLPDHAAPSDQSGPDYRAAMEKETFALINRYRAAEDLPALKWNDGVAKLARAHSKDMATGEVDFGHGGFRDRVDRLKALIAGFHGAGENVFMADRLDNIAQRAVATWLKSPHHLENIRGDYNYSGLGVWQSNDGTLYFTQLFLKVVAPTEEAVVKEKGGPGVAAIAL